MQHEAHERGRRIGPVRGVDWLSSMPAAARGKTRYPSCSPARVLADAWLGGGAGVPLPPHWPPLGPEPVQGAAERCLLAHARAASRIGAQLPRPVPAPRSPPPLPPHVLFVHGTADDVVDVNQSRVMARVLVRGRACGPCLWGLSPGQAATL